MDNNDMDYYEEDSDKKKFRLTRGMLILAAVILVVIIIIIVLIVHSINSKKPEYTNEDFIKLESRMEEESPTYLDQNGIELSDQELTIDLKELLIENGGGIDPSRVKAAKICKGYVIAVEKDTQKYDAYIKCGNLYTTSGYVSNGSVTTKKTTKKVKDTTKPVITIIGGKEIELKLGETYKDPGVTALDNIDGDITSSVKTSGSVDTSKAGVYTLTYTVTDKAGNRTQESRKITVLEITTTTKASSSSNSSQSGTKSTTKKQIYTTKARPTTAPTITLSGSKTITLDKGTRYVDPGYSARDALGSDITSKVSVSGYVNTNMAGTYTITYSVTDSYKNKATTFRTIIIRDSNVKLTGLSLSPNAFDLSVGGTLTLKVYYSPSNATNKSLSWSSDNPSVATVFNGVVTGKAKGMAVIKATSSNGISSTSRVYVK